MFHQNETIMKTASVQHLSTTINNELYASYQSGVSKLTNVNTYIMNKLTNVSPFLLLLIPVFVMMAFTITTSTTLNNTGNVAMKATPATEMAKLTTYQAK